ncbi:DNA-binding protein [Streptomyces sp. Lzd4kr]|nr:DNA-binding protein [Streptomyces sp. Lzd4kr]
MTVPQVIACLQLGRSAVNHLLRTPQLASITLARAYLVRAQALADFIRTGLEHEAA